MTIFQIIFVISAIIFIGIPLYLFVGKAGRKIGAATVGISYTISFWSAKEFQETYDKIKDDAPMKVIWPLVIPSFLFLIIIAVIIRFGWLAYLAIRVGVKFYWKSLKYCWE